jgi:Na+/phosphate symporter
MSLPAALHNEQKSRTWVNALLAAFFLYLFLCAINVMGSGLKGIGN